MFIMPSDTGIPGIDIPYNQSVDNGTNYDNMLAQTDFNLACANALLQGCSTDMFSSVYSQCIQIYGNLTLEQCRSRCCDSS
jgi:hypothetical protein